MEELLMIYEDKMEKSLANLGEEYATIRAGRANPHILDKIKIDYYGTPTPLQQVGNVSVPEARMICIQPWDASILKDIEHAINMSDVGINPTNDGKVIRRTEEKNLLRMLRRRVKMPRLLSVTSEEMQLMPLRRKAKKTAFQKMK